MTSMSLLAMYPTGELRVYSFDDIYISLTSCRPFVCSPNNVSSKNDQELNLNQKNNDGMKDATSGLEPHSLIQIMYKVPASNPAYYSNTTLQSIANFLWLSNPYQVHRPQTNW